MENIKAKEFDAIVVGAGPAGSSCALFLSRAGARVLLLDKAKFPRDKTCADNKTWICTSLLKQLGLWKEFLKLPKQEITGLLFSTPGGQRMRVSLDEAKRRREGPHYNVRRLVFDEFLFNAAKKSRGVSANEGFTVKRVLTNQKNFVLGVEGKNARGHERKFFAKIVVAADGSESAVARSAGFEPVIRERQALSVRAYYRGVRCDPHTVELHYLKEVAPGYFWIFPVDGRLCNVGVGMPAKVVAEKKIVLAETLEKIISSPEFAPRFKAAKRVSPLSEWGITIVLKRRRVCRDGLLLSGDAANTAVAFGGEGVGPAMRSGKLAASAIARCLERNDFSEKNLRSLYEDELWRVRSAENKGAAALEFLATHPRVFDFVVRRASRHEKLGRLASEIASDYSNAAKLVSPKTIARLLFG